MTVVNKYIAKIIATDVLAIYGTNSNTDGMIWMPSVFTSNLHLLPMASLVTNWMRIQAWDLKDGQSY